MRRIIITYDNNLNNSNIVGGQVSINNNNNKEIYFSRLLSSNNSEITRTSDSVMELTKNSQITLKNPNTQVDITQSIRDNVSEPDLT
jgi:hypothetical protein